MIFFLSSGMHTLADHAKVLESVPLPSLECISLIPRLDDSGTDVCNSCFFNLLLSQALFPVVGEPVIAESFHARACYFPISSPFLALGREVNRGPPSRTVLS
jgi:hypothetical protein